MKRKFRASGERCIISFASAAEGKRRSGTVIRAGNALAGAKSKICTRHGGLNG
jgi:hypothetical protein